jgi:putative oxidoreductase
MSALAARYERPVYAILRIVAGAMLACHGMQKMFGWLGGHQIPLGSQLGVGGLIELSTGLLVALGLFTRGAAFLASGTMAVAYIQFHWKMDFADGAWLPIVNHGELAVVYCFLFLSIVTRGGGAASIDGLRKSLAGR